ncbi:bZIP transcription factor family protein [Striga asiatica]|uniref:BZIP transcription factor family protein n=1 Tax=Striga asiatica TaxID=4170 RepID=A0A5A7P6G1_STRAF|nr:bZIP transcription factor family protein [Striga asiatica]
MHNSFKASATQAIDLYCHNNQTPFYLRNEEAGRNGPRFSDLGELEQSAGNGFHHEDNAVNLSRSSVYNELKASNVSVVSNNMQFGGLSNAMVSNEMVSSGTGLGFISHKETNAMVGVGGALGRGHFENWTDSGIVADHSQQTDTSTDTDDKNQFCNSHGFGDSFEMGYILADEYNGVHREGLIVVDSVDQCRGKIGDQKVLRRLAQNREAARKSRMRKKAYVQQLENSRLKLTQLEQELKRARQQSMFVSSGISGNQNQCVGGNGALAFDMDYARWLDEHNRLMNDLRSAVSSHVGDNELRLLVESVMSHYDELFRLKSIGSKSDVFHMLSGMWKTPAERCFMWLGGFRCSEILKILGNQIEPLTDQQLVGICNLQQSSQQAEDALSQGMEALQQSLVETLSSNSLPSRPSLNVADYMGQMAIAMTKLATLENFLHQADLLRQQTLQQLQRILTTRQAARALLAISDYMSRLRALSSLWLARPKE